MLMIQENQNGKSNPTAGKNTLLFEAFRYFQCFRILANTANFCRINFMSDKFDNWAGEYHRGKITNVKFIHKG